MTTSDKEALFDFLRRSHTPFSVLRNTIMLDVEDLGRVLLPAVSGPGQTDTRCESPLNPAERSLIHAGMIIQAIKSMRERHGLGLKEAKDIVDNFRDGKTR